MQIGNEPVDIACEICRRNTETTEQVTNNRMKLIYGILWHDMYIDGLSRRAWDLMKSFLSHEEKGIGITMARELIGRVALLEKKSTVEAARREGV